jgi:hypothetical protein
MQNSLDGNDTTKKSTTGFTRWRWLAFLARASKLKGTNHHLDLRLITSTKQEASTLPRKATTR